MKPPRNNTQYQTNTRSVLLKQDDMQHVAAIQTFALHNEFTPPAIRKIWTAIEQSRNDADGEQRRRKR